MDFQHTKLDKNKILAVVVNRRNGDEMTYQEFVADEVKQEVYDALSQIMFDYEASKQDMDEAIRWFNTHFYENKENI